VRSHAAKARFGEVQEAAVEVEIARLKGGS
jgi:hypothetical protein